MKKKKQNLDFQVALDFFIEMKYYTIQNYLKKCRHSVGTAYDHEIT